MPLREQDGGQDWVMPKRCADCAFTAGTEANRSELTQITTEFCLMSGEPFYCHANAVHVDGALRLPEGNGRLCRGFSDALDALDADPKPWQRAIAQEALVIMEEAEDRAKAGQPELSVDEFWLRIMAAGSLAARERT